MNRINNLGVFSTLEAVWTKHPEGGREGDYVTIAGIEYQWNKYDLIWENSETYTESNTIRTLEIYGDRVVHGDLTILGTLKSHDVQSSNCGLFRSEESLRRLIRHPRVGYWAYVGEGDPVRKYICEEDGVWKNSGSTAGLGSVVADIDVLTERIDAAREAVEKRITKEEKKRESSDEELSIRVAALETSTADADALAVEIRAREEGDSALGERITQEANAWTDAVVGLRGATSKVRSDLETALGKEVEARTELSERVSKVEQGVTGGGGYYNVTTKHPLSSGYYTLETAISALVGGGEVSGDKRKGLIITIETSEGKWVDYRYTGDASDEQFSSAPMWKVHTAIDAIVVDGKRHLPHNGVITLESQNIDVAQSVDDSDRPVSSAAVKAELDEVKEFYFDADTDQTDEGTQVTLSDRGRQVAQFVVAGGGGSSAGVSTKAVVTARLNASRIKLGDGVRLSYGYVHYSDGIQDGIGSTATLTLRRGAQTIAVESLGALMSGEERTLELGRYITSADSYSITITAIYEEDGHEKRRVATAQLSVVNLSISLYNRSELESYISVGGYKDTDAANIILSVRGGAKEISMYIDGDSEAAETKVLSGSSSRQTFVLPVRSLRAGTHSLQFVASIDGLKSNSIYIDILKSGSNDAFCGLIFSRLDGRIFASGETPEIQARQYEATEWDYIAIGRGAVGGVASLTLEQPHGATSFTAPRSYQTLTSRYTHKGILPCAYKLDGITKSFRISVEASSLVGIGIKDGAHLELLAVGRSNAEATPYEWRSNTIETIFEGVDWSSSGWTGDALKLINGAKAHIGYKPFASDVKNTGLSISMELRINNVRSATGSVVSCYDVESSATSSFGGILISPSFVKMPTGGRVEFVSEDGETIVRDLGLDAPFASGKYYNVVLVVHPSSEQRNIRVYINGVISKADTYQDTIFEQRRPQDITLDSTHADLEVRHIRVWETALSDDEILQNYITDRPTIGEMEMLRERNDVLDDHTGDISYDKLYQRGNGVLNITMEDGGGIERLWGKSTDTKTNYRLAELVYRSPFGRSYDLKVTNAVIRRQGTSTSTYPIKNLRIYLSRVTDTKVYRNVGNGQEDKWEVNPDRTYIMREGAKPMNIINLKTDFADSSMMNNTEGAKLWNMLSRSIPSIQTIGMKSDPSARAAIDGIAISVFTSDSPEGQKRYCGQFQFNNDKSKSGYLFGQTKKDGTEIALEGINNTNAVANFHFSGDVATQLALGNADGFDASFEFLYPEKDYVWATAPENIKEAVVRLCRWIHDCRPEGQDPGGMTESEVKESFKSERFKREIAQYFQVDNLCAWWVWTDYMMAVDQRVKNTFFRTWDGKVWAFTYYDGDTSWRLRNDSFLAYLYNINRDSWDAQRNKYAFEGHRSILWALVLANLDADLKRVATEMRRVLTDDVVRKGVNSPHTHYSEREYNKSLIYKYIKPTYTDYNGGGTMNYIFALNGTMQASKEDVIKRRFSLLDAGYNPDDMARRDNIPCYIGKGDVLTTIVLHSGDDYYYGWSTQNGGIRQYERTNTGETLTLTFPDAISQNDPVRLAGASRIVKLDLATTAPYVQGAMNLNGCAMLSELAAPISSGRGSQWYPLLGKISGLKKIDLTGHSGITGTEDEQARTFDVSSHTGLLELKLQGTSVRAIRIGEGSPLVRLELPTSLTTLRLRALPSLEMSGLIVSDWSKITSLELAGCPHLHWRTILDKCTSLERVRIEGVSFEDDGTLLDKLYHLKGIDANGSGVETCELVGKVQLTKYIDDDKMKMWQVHYPSLEIRQPDYTMVEFDESVTDPANMSNLDNNTGYKFGNAYEPSAHISAILRARKGVVGKQATDGVMSVYPLHDWDFTKFADSSVWSQATDANLLGGDGDFFIYEPEYWYKGVNDYRAKKNYACLAYGRKPSNPDPDLVKVIPYTELSKQAGHYVAIGGRTLGESFREDERYNSYLVEVGIGRYSKIRTQMSNLLQNACLVFLNEDNEVLSGYSIQQDTGDFISGMYVIHDIPKECARVAFCIEKFVEDVCPFVVLSNSEKVEDMEPEWVYHKPVLIGMFKGHVIDGKLYSRLADRDTYPTTMAGIDSWKNLAKLAGLKIMSYEALNCVRHLSLLKHGTRHHRQSYGNAPHRDWRYASPSGRLLITGFNDITYSPTNQNQYGYYLTRGEGMATFKLTRNDEDAIFPVGKMMGYEQLFSGRNTYLGGIAVMAEATRSNIGHGRLMIENRLRSFDLSGSHSPRNIIFGKHMDLLGFDANGRSFATLTTAWGNAGVNNIGQVEGEFVATTGAVDGTITGLTTYRHIEANYTARPMFDGKINFISSLEEYKKIISKY